MSAFEDRLIDQLSGDERGMLSDEVLLSVLEKIIDDDTGSLDMLATLLARILYYKMQ